MPAPFRVIQRYLKWRFGLGLSVGEQRGQEEYTRYAKRFGPARWCTGTKRAGVKMAVMATSGASALPRCFPLPAGPEPVVEQVLGDEFEGVLSASYGAYNVYPHQRGIRTN